MLTCGSISLACESLPFPDCVSGNSYSKEFFIHNVGKKPIRVRYTLPYDEHFTLIGNSSALIPPGLEAKGIIRYFCRTPINRQTVLTIQCADGAVRLPITTSGPKALVLFGKREIDFGVFSQKAVVREKISLENKGSDKCNFTIGVNDLSLTVKPESGCIPMRETVWLTLEYKARVAGPFECCLTAKVKDLKVDPVVVKGDAVNQEVSLLYENEEVKALGFGTIYFGQKKVLQVTVKNRSALKRSFVVMPPRERKAEFGTSAHNVPDDLFMAVPCEGTLGPFGSSVVSFVYSPVMTAPEDEPKIEEMANWVSAVVVKETKQRIDFDLSGSGTAVNCDVNSAGFHFGRQLVGSEARQTLVIKNNSPLLPVSWSLKRMAHFRFWPESGTIGVNGKGNVKISFLPKCMGEFEFANSIVLANGLSKLKISVTGTGAGKPGDVKSFKRTPLWETEASAKLNAEEPETKYGLTGDQLRRKSSLREKFDGYITKKPKRGGKKAASGRAEEPKVGDDPQDMEAYIQAQIGKLRLPDANGLGMSRNEGMQPPDPVFPKRPDNLVVPEPMGLGLISTSARGSSRPQSARMHSARSQSSRVQSARSQRSDSRNAPSTKFKSTPTTPPEMSECIRTLDPNDIGLITVSDQTLDFGIVAIYALAERTFEVSNDLEQHILVTMNYDDERLSRSDPVTQVVPPQRTALFTIAVFATKIGEFVHRIRYSINNKHEYALTVSANLVGMDVALARKSINFSMTDAKKPFVEETVTLFNKSESTARYQWSPADAAFSIKPENGNIEANSSVTATVTFTPRSQLQSECAATLSVIGGKEQILRLKADLGNPRVALSSKAVVFGMIRTAVKEERQVYLKNSGTSEAVFSIDDRHRCLTVSPNFGHIPPGAKVALSVALFCDRPHDLSLVVPIQVCGLPAIIMKISASPQTPRIEIVGDLSFPDVFVGGFRTENVGFKNDGFTPLSLQVDFTDYPFFKFDVPAKYSQQTPNDLVSFVKVSSSGGGGLIYQIAVAPKETVSLDLTFQPNAVGELDFVLPVSIPNGTVDRETKVTANSVHSPLELSETEIDFGVCYVFDAENPSMATGNRHVVLRSQSRSRISWKFKNDSKDFIVRPSAGQLEAGLTVNLEVNFRPTEDLPRNISIPLFASSPDGELLVAQLHLVGVGTKRRFRTSTPCLCLATVPLLVTSAKMIYILNCGGDLTKLSVKMPVHTKVFPVKFTFPDGKVISQSKPKLPLLVSFNSDKPMSFSTVVAIVGADGFTCSFTVHVSADNSVFTLYPFMSLEPYNVTGENGNPITLTTENDPVQNDFMSEFISLADILDAKVHENKTRDTLSAFLLKFLNQNILDTDIETFPDDLIESNGKILLEIIEKLTGRHIPESQVFGKVQHNGRTTASRLEKMTGILRFLASRGAHLSAVKPEYLLSKKDFIEECRKGATKHLLGIDYHNAPEMASIDKNVLNQYLSTPIFAAALLKRVTVADSVYSELCRESWIIVILQVLKLFFESKIAFDQFAKVPGVSKALEAIRGSTTRTTLSEIDRGMKAITGSNVFNQIESTVLKWMTLHFCRSNTSNMIVLYDFVELRDPNIVASILKSHLPRETIETGRKYKDYADMQQRANELATFVSDLGIDITVEADDILNGSACALALVAIQLYLKLPHFVPCAGTQFNVALGRWQVQKITISNPATFELTYRGSIKGSSDFRLLENCVVIKPGESCEIGVEYFARTHLPQSAVVTLIPDKVKSPVYTRPGTPGTSAYSRSGSVVDEPLKKMTTAASVVIDLEAVANIAEPLDRIEIESPIYETYKIQIPVKNVMRSKGLFGVYTRFFHLCDENENRLGPKAHPSAQMREFLNDPHAYHKYPTAPTPFIGILQKHQAFLASPSEIEFNDEASESMLEIEFVPISLGTYRCLVLVLSKDGSEFVYEIIAKALVPNPTLVGNELDVEITHTKSVSIEVDGINTKLCDALTYSMTKCVSRDMVVSEQKFQDLIIYHNRDIITKFEKAFVATSFSVVTSMGSFFRAPEMFRTTGNESLTVSFTPTKAGDYMCKIVLASDYDVRCYQIQGVGHLAVKGLTLEMTAIMGRPVKQLLPFNNPSNTVWNFDAKIVGDAEFSIERRFAVPPRSCHQVPLHFLGKRVGKFDAQLVVTNLTKGLDVRYILSSITDEPPAEGKVVIYCKAKEEHRQTLELPSFIENGCVSCESTLPFIKVPATVDYIEGIAQRTFEMEVVSSRSGVAAGRLKFTDETSGNFFWYVLDVNVEMPEPEDIINVTAVARETATVKISVYNPSHVKRSFEVSFSEDDFFGNKILEVPAKSTLIYDLVFSPLTPVQRTSYVSFSNDEDGEFIYQLNCVSTAGSMNTIAPVSSPIGKFTSMNLIIENPTQKKAYFQIENQNSDCFHVMSQTMVQLAPGTKSSLEVRYLPTAIGVQQTSVLSVKSREAGEWVYKLVGVGKPPNPQTPVVLECRVDESAVGSVDFLNPFTRMTKFETSLTVDKGDSVILLSKRRMFTLGDYGDTHQISFAFMPHKVTEFLGSLIVSTVDREQTIQWVYPVIAKTTRSKETFIVTGKAWEMTETSTTVSLAGESEIRNLDSYRLQVGYQEGYKWLEKAVNIELAAIDHSGEFARLTVRTRANLRRPLQSTVMLTITNPFTQKWHFPVTLNIEAGDPNDAINIESLLNATAVHCVVLRERFTEPTPFRSYLAVGSATEFSITAGSGQIDPTLDAQSQLPFEIHFRPSVYGKVMRGLLVIDTLEIQFLIDIIGKLPEYVPPSGITSTLGTRPMSEVGSARPATRRNIIRDNIQNVRSGRSALQSARGDRRRPFVS